MGTHPEYSGMVSDGENAPEFTAPLADGDVGTFELSDELEAEGPIVLAFFPGAFTRVCNHEMDTFQDRLDRFTEHDATVYGVSVDSPFVLNELREQLSLEFDLISDANREIIHEYDAATSFDQYGIDELAQRAVFVIDDSGTITYAWIADNPGQEPDYDEVEAAAKAAAE